MCLPLFNLMNKFTQFSIQSQSQRTQQSLNGWKASFRRTSADSTKSAMHLRRSGTRGTTGMCWDLRRSRSIARKKWDFKRAHAYRLIDSAKVVEVLSPIGDIQPVTESQCRPLSRLEPEQQLIAWKKAVSDRSGNITASRQWRSFNLGHRRKP